MIRSSALLTVVAMAMLVAGVSAANLGLIYLSIAVSIVAAVTGAYVGSPEPGGHNGGFHPSDGPSHDRR